VQYPNKNFDYNKTFLHHIQKLNQKKQREGVRHDVQTFVQAKIKEQVQKKTPPKSTVN
jgi:hypothetical protein